MSGQARRSDERGSASVLGVQLLAMVAILTLACVGVAAIVLAHRRAQAAADLAALAGATAVQRGDSPCGEAARLAARNHGELTSCVVSGDVVSVQVTVRTAPILGGSRTLSARARAGPAEGLTPTG